MILLDANVLIYAVGGEHPLKPVAADLVSLAHELPLRTTRGAIEEFAHAYARRGRPRSDTVDYVVAWSEAFDPILVPSEEDFSAAFDLWQKFERLDVFDAFLAAIALRTEAPLISADRAYADVADLKFLDLADPDLLERLAPN